MENNNKNQQKKQEPPAAQDARKVTEQAHNEADKDMEADAEFTATSPNDDLDEAESAMLGEDKTDLV